MLVLVIEVQHVIPGCQGAKCKFFKQEVKMGPLRDLPGYSPKPGVTVRTTVNGCACAEAMEEHGRHREDVYRRAAEAEAAARRKGASWKVAAKRWREVADEYRNRKCAYYEPK